MLCLFARGARGRVSRLLRRVRRRSPSRLLRRQGEFQPGCTEHPRAPRKRLRHRFRRRVGAGHRRRRRSGEDRVLRRRQDAARNGSRAGGRHPVLQRRVGRRARDARCDRPPRRQDRPDFAAGESRRRPENAPLHRDRSQGEQVRCRLRGRARTLPPRRRPSRRCGARYRLPHRLADHRNRGLCGGRREDVRARRPARSRRHRSAPRGPGRRARHSLPRRGNHRSVCLRARRDGGRAVRGNTSSCSSRAGSWSAMPACC